MREPSNTLLFRAEGPQVGVVQADGAVQLRSVKLGRDFGKIALTHDHCAPIDVFDSTYAMEEGVIQQGRSQRSLVQ